MNNNNKDENEEDKDHFKFDISADSPLFYWIDSILSDIYKIQNIPHFPVKSLPVSSWITNAGIGNTYQYLGSNYHGTPIWKTKYFIKDALNTEYKNHIKHNAVHFISQPVYYKGMFDILN